MNILKGFLPIVFFWIFVTGTIVLSFIVEGDGLKLSGFVYAVICIFSCIATYENL